MSTTVVFLMGDEPIAVRGDKPSAMARRAMRRVFQFFALLIASSALFR